MSDEKQEEQEIILETEEPSEEPVAEEAPQEEPAKASEEGELESYSKGVQNRIKKLTERYRQEERDKAEAVRLSQQLLEENKRLKTRVQSLDSGYLNEYGNRLESQTLAAKQMYKEAHEAGDPDKMLEAQELISKIAVERQKYESAKKQAETSKLQVKKKLVKPDAPQQQQPQAQQPPAQPDPKAQAWAEENKWFGEDRVMTMAAFAINQQLIEEEGFDPTSDEYYTEIDSRIRKEFPHKFEEAPAAKKTGGGSQVASAGNSASRSTKQGRRSVKLSHSQVAIAKKLGVPLEEYAKYVKE